MFEAGRRAGKVRRGAAGGCGRVVVEETVWGARGCVGLGRVSGDAGAVGAELRWVLWGR